MAFPCRKEFSNLLNAELSLEKVLTMMKMFHFLRRWLVDLTCDCCSSLLGSWSCLRWLDLNSREINGRENFKVRCCAFDVVGIVLVLRCCCCGDVADIDSLKMNFYCIFPHNITINSSRRYGERREREVSEANKLRFDDFKIRFLSSLLFWHPQIQSIFARIYFWYLKFIFSFLIFNFPLDPFPSNKLELKMTLVLDYWKVLHAPHTPNGDNFSWRQKERKTFFYPISLVVALMTSNFHLWTFFFFVRKRENDENSEENSDICNFSHIFSFVCAPADIESSLSSFTEVFSSSFYYSIADSPPWSWARSAARQ